MDLFGEESETMWLGDGAENVQAMLAAELEFMVAEVFSFFFFLSGLTVTVLGVGMRFE